MKKFLTIGFLFTLSSTHTTEVGIQTHPTLPNVLVADGWDTYPADGWDTYPRERALIAWDLNGVVFEADTSLANVARMVNDVREQYGLRYALWAYSQYFWIWREKTRLKAAGDPAGFVWDAMFDRQDPQLAGVFRNSALRSNILSLSTTELLYRLSAKGHTNGVLSNMGTKLLQPLINKIESEEQTPSKAYVLEEFLKNPNRVISSPENNWMHKPQPEMYNLFMRNFNQTSSQLTIFVDDKRSNCIAALENGFKFAIICNNLNDLPTIFEQLGLL